MSWEQDLGHIGRELRLIRLALERISPPPPRKEPPEGTRRGRSITVL